jgi:hypothetical protein
MLDQFMNSAKKQADRLDSSEKALLELYRQLDSQQQQTLTEFAAFLCSRSVPVSAQQQSPDATIPEPEAIERPTGESVVAAMKRLSATYPMIEKAALLNEASGLMAQHIMQGREAVEVIDELEALFASHYQQLKQGKS